MSQKGTAGMGEPNPSKKLKVKETEEEKARKVLKEAHEKNVAECNAKIQDILKEYGLDIKTETLIHLVPRG